MAKKGLLLLGAAAAAYALTQTNTSGTQSANVSETLPFNPNLQRGEKGEKGDKGDKGDAGNSNLANNSFSNGALFLEPNAQNYTEIYLKSATKKFRFIALDDKLSIVSMTNAGADPLVIFEMTPTGTISKIGGGSFAAISDERMKKEIVPFTSGLDKVLAIEPKKFKYDAVEGTPTENYPQSITDKQQYGVIAQQLQKVCPEMVSTDGQGFLSVDLSNLSLLLINAVKEQQALITALTARVVALETANTPTA